jgi:hypothetical protein
MLKKYFLLFVISITIYFAHAIYTYQGLYGDGNGYYVYTQSIFFDHKLNSEKVYNYLSNFQGKNYIFSRIFWNPDRNPFSIGTGIIWLPGIIITSLFENNRFDIVYELACGITGIILMISGLRFLEKYLLNFYSKRQVFWTILTTFFATNVFYYTAFEPALSHQPSFFLICFLLWWTYKFRRSNLNFFILGLLFGLMGIVRMADTILLIPIIFQSKPKIRDLVYIVIGGLIMFIPQLINQYIQYGSILTNLYFTGANGTWHINPIHLFQHLFSPRRGLFLWSPVLLIGFWGLLRSRAKVFLTAILILWLVSSSWSAYLTAGFGQRLSFSAIPFFASGIAYVIQKMKLKKIIAIFLIFSLWNLLLLKNVYLHKDLFIQKENFGINEFTKYMLLLK